MSDKPQEEPVLPEPSGAGKGGAKRKAGGEAAGAAGAAKGKKAK